MANLEPHYYNSFSYKTTNNIIRDVLTQRSLLNNTVQVAMPFIKATTTIQHDEYLGAGNIGFSLGLHSIDENVEYQNIYSSTESEGPSYPLVGYTYSGNQPTRLYARPPSTAAGRFNALFDQGVELVTTPDGRFTRMPPPGITKMTIGKNKNGLLAVGDLEISVPTLSQLEFLHRTFLIPNVGMVLEWGQQFSPGVGVDPSTIKQHMFPWYDRERLIPLLERLADRNVGLEEILKDYAYPTQGQYMWMFGRVGNFSTIANNDGSFNCSVRVVGPSEDSWAYSTKITVVPPRDDTGKICIEETNSIDSYFRDTVAGGLNLKTLLDDTISGKILTGWKSHVIKIDNGNKREGEKTKDDTAEKPNISEMGFADADDAYFMTWRFFVNVVINHPKYGLRKIFNDALTVDQQLKINLLRPYGDPNNLDSPGENYIDDPLESYVGLNKFLRSSDPSTMLIINSIAAELANVNELREKYKNIIEQNSDSKLKGREGEFSAKFESLGDVTRTPLNPETNDQMLLTTGVWLNHRSVVESMLSGDTLLRGVTNLLDRMSQATTTYWQLALDAVEPIDSVPNQNYTYTVVDLNYRQNSEAAKNLIRDIHNFNKYVRRQGDRLVGSELTDCKVDLSLPKRLFAQIATIGLIQPGDLEKANGDGPSECKHGLVSDANDTLREMFGITSLSTLANDGKSPDLTYKKSNSPQPARICKNSNIAATTAGASGQGVRPQQSQSSSTPERQQKDLQEAQSRLQNTQQIINEGGGCPATTSVSDNSPLAQQVRGTSVSVDDLLDCSSALYTNVRGRQLLCRQGCISGNMPTSLLADAGNGKLAFKATVDAFKRLQAKYARDFNGGTLLPNAGLNGKARTGYRTFRDQYEIWLDVKAKGGIVSPPGRGDHEMGLALDLSSYFTDNDVGKAWIQANASDEWDIVFEPKQSTHIRLKNIPQSYLVEAQRECAPVNARLREGREPQAPTNTAEEEAKKQEQYRKIGYAQYESDRSLLSAEEQDRQRPPTAAEAQARGEQICKEYTSLQQQVSQLQTVTQENQKFADATARIRRNFNALNIVFKYVEMNPEKMVAEIRCDADGNRSNAFGASPGSLSLSADLTLPGINGFRVGELFWIDRIPSFYKVFGAFQILSIEDVITIDGWQTNIHSRFNYLGNAWKTSVFELLGT